MGRDKQKALHLAPLVPHEESFKLNKAPKETQELFADYIRERLGGLHLFIKFFAQKSLEIDCKLLYRFFHKLLDKIDLERISFVDSSYSNAERELISRSLFTMASIEEITQGALAATVNMALSESLRMTAERISY